MQKKGAAVTASPRGLSDVYLRELVVDDSVDQGGLPHSGVSDQDDVTPLLFLRRLAWPRLTHPPSRSDAHVAGDER